MSLEKYKRKVVEVDYLGNGQWGAYYPCDMDSGPICTCPEFDSIVMFLDLLDEIFSHEKDRPHVVLSDAVFLLSDLESSPEERKILQIWGEEGD